MAKRAHSDYGGEYIEEKGVKPGVADANHRAGDELEYREVVEVLGSVGPLGCFSLLLAFITTSVPVHRCRFSILPRPSRDHRQLNSGNV